jgi:hypothetical protein
MRRFGATPDAVSVPVAPKFCCLIGYFALFPAATCMDPGVRRVDQLFEDGNVVI